MFQELNKLEAPREKKMNDIRLRFGLKEINFHDIDDVIEEVFSESQNIITESEEEQQQEFFFGTESQENPMIHKTEDETVVDKMDDSQDQQQLEVVEIQIPKFLEVSNLSANDVQISELSSNEVWIRNIQEGDEFIDMEGGFIQEDDNEFEEGGEEDEILEDVTMENYEHTETENFSIEKTEDEKFFE